jgi:hypothetical protein
MANRRAYLHYFIDYYRDRDPLINRLTIDDLRESRLYLVDPAPIRPMNYSAPTTG